MRLSWWAILLVVLLGLGILVSFLALAMLLEAQYTGDSWMSEVVFAVVAISVFVGLFHLSWKITDGIWRALGMVGSRDSNSDQPDGLNDADLQE
ncbi:hypothetical protein A6F68_01894 [Tsuneonella dongtanensis]|uniref:Uncharacterized protein n=1 Tax=Tsuneonella dongtanensis TaxID=692370 RepID=A0A1B2AE37_9SPHN|nr:hypothetical protein [Tsuneonella dongtanensis]ANY20404.1 hypothetical protein A6F68_01894 [Tsuneonella dongtanensis]